MARNPDNLNKVLINNLEEDVLVFDEIQDMEYELPYDLNDSKQYFKYINLIKNIIRSSMEYSELMNFLKNNGMDSCVFLPNVTNRETFKIRIEIHHEPFTLFDIIVAVVNKRKDLQESIHPFDVAKEVMYLHYKGLIGLVPLSEVAHELVHNSFIFVPTTVVLGNYNEFINLYSKYIDPEAMSIVKKIEECSKEYNLDAAREVFKVMPTYIDDGKNTPEELMEYIKENLNSIALNNKNG